jgi:hypothetical protein
MQCKQRLHPPSPPFLTLDARLYDLATGAGGGGRQAPRVRGGIQQRDLGGTHICGIS